MGRNGIDFPLQYCGSCGNRKDKTSLNFFFLNPEALEGKVSPKDVHLPFFLQTILLKLLYHFYRIFKNEKYCVGRVLGIWLSVCYSWNERRNNTGYDAQVLNRHTL